MNPLSSEKLRVKIYGRDYELDPGGLTPLEANQLAGYVDQKMREIAERSNIVDSQKIAVLAALNIALEMTQQKSAGRGLPPDDEQSVKGMLAVLEKSLK